MTQPSAPSPLLSCPIPGTMRTLLAEARKQAIIHLAPILPLAQRRSVQRQPPGDGGCRPLYDGLSGRRQIRASSSLGVTVALVVRSSPTCASGPL